MAETLTVDTTPNTEVLTADEQDSLEIGEQMQTAQDNLLAGKYKDAQELEKAYIELQGKLGSPKEEKEDTSQELEIKKEEEETKETKADKVKAVQAIVTRVLQAVSMAGGDTDSTKLALMGILGTPGFRSYQQQEIPDVAFYDTTVAYESTSYIDPLGSVLSLGSDSMMNDLVDSQYK